MFVINTTVNISCVKWMQQLCFFSPLWSGFKPICLSEQSHVASHEKPSSAESPWISNLWRRLLVASVARWCRSALCTYSTMKPGMTQCIWDLTVEANWSQSDWSSSAARHYESFININKDALNYCRTLIPSNRCAEIRRWTTEITMPVRRLHGWIQGRKLPSDRLFIRFLICPV